MIPSMTETKQNKTTKATAVTSPDLFNYMIPMLHVLYMLTVEFIVSVPFTCVNEITLSTNQMRYHNFHKADGTLSILLKFSC